MRTHSGMILRTFAALALATAVLAPAAHAVTITIVNADGVGEGFNDPTAAAPIAGNSGTTIGAQRLIVFQTAASVWGSILPGTQTIQVSSQFNALTCTATSAVLGSAGPINVHANFPGTEFTGYWYNTALANQKSGSDLNGATAEIQAQFNSNLGNVGCLTGVPWYYGLDHNEAGSVDLLAVILHEMGHGLGFMTVTSGSTGAFVSGPPALPSLWDRFLYDEATGLHWDVETPAQRVASAISVDKLSWDGKAVKFMVPFTMNKAPRLNVASPAPVAGSYAVGTASFGAAISATPVTGTVVLADDGFGTTSDACEPIVGNLPGKIAFIDRGTCGFTVKALNAQSVGAIGAIIVNNVPGAAIGLGGSDPNVTIPVICISQADGATLRPQIAAGMTASIVLDPNAFAGTNPSSRRMLLYAPATFAGGSSVSHWDVSASPNLMMEPAINGDLTSNVDLARYLFEDIGWLPRTTNVPGGPALRAGGLSGAPNPFSAATSVRFALTRPGLVDLVVFDVNGRAVRRLTQSWMPAGEHVVAWDGADGSGRPVSPGVYLTRLKSAEGSSMQRLVRVQ